MYSKPRLYAKPVCAGQVSRVELAWCLQGKGTRRMENWKDQGSVRKVMYQEAGMSMLLVEVGFCYERNVQ